VPFKNHFYKKKKKNKKKETGGLQATTNPWNGSVPLEVTRGDSQPPPSKIFTKPK
jgi:hypothetical protein